MWLALFFAFAAASDWVVELKPHVDPEQFGRTHGFQLIGALGFLPHFYRYKADARHRNVRTLETDDSVFAEAQIKRARQWTRIADPLYGQQWHLHAHPSSLETDHADGLKGANVTIAIVDDGLEHTHSDLRANYDALHSWDFNDLDADPMPGDARSGHGTAAAGVAAAVKDNGHCGRGVAPAAKLVGIRAIADGVTDEVEAESLTHNGIAAVDIYSCSWGPPDDGRSIIGPGYVTQMALAQYTNGARGRLGKGNIYIWAAGNGRDRGDSCAFDGYASSPYVIAVGALDYHGDQAWYSEGCAALMAMAPSSGGDYGITTVDLTGPPGYDPSECTDRFGGTSAAAPAAAGVVALLLEMRPELSWRDVKHIIARGSTPVHTEDPDWHMNAAGYRHSHRFGFGLLKVPPLVRAAQQHQLVPHPATLWMTGPKNLDHPLGWMPFNHTIHVNTSTLHVIETVAIVLSITHERRGSIVVDLESPEGTISHLAVPRGADDGINYPSGGWQFVSVRHWGETHANGDWILRVNDVRPDALHPGRVNGYDLRLMGY